MRPADSFHKFAVVFEGRITAFTQDDTTPVTNGVILPVIPDQVSVAAQVEINGHSLGINYEVLPDHVRAYYQEPV